MSYPPPPPPSFFFIFALGLLNLKGYCPGSAPAGTEPVVQDFFHLAHDFALSRCVV